MKTELSFDKLYELRSGALAIAELVTEVLNLRALIHWKDEEIKTLRTQVEQLRRDIVDMR
jgi:hypothetical protein